MNFTSVTPESLVSIGGPSRVITGVFVVGCSVHWQEIAGEKTPYWATVANFSKASVLSR
jgi:hypothetical protein